MDGCPTSSGDGVLFSLEQLFEVRDLAIDFSPRCFRWPTDGRPLRA
jgi:hypothetical protein